MAKAIDIGGKRFDRLTVVARQGRVKQGKAWSAGWLCLCDCGNTRVAAGTDLRKGLVRSCGCSIDGKPRGRSKHPLFNIYQGMLDRCHNPDSKDFPNYGGRGIVVCNRWREDFDRFAADVGPRPSLKHTLDRRDNHGPYDPANCRWATAAEQHRNMRNNYLPGLTSGDIATLTGVKAGTFRARITKGWDVERAMDARDFRRSDD